MTARGGLLLAGALLLAGCGEEAEEAPPQTQTVELTERESEASTRGNPEVIEADDGDAADALPLGTPPSERVATLGLLNKRNNLTQDIELRPGEQVVIDDVRIRLSTCEKTPPWESPPETGAFAQLDVKPTNSDDGWKRIFSGWLFLSSPSLNVVEHPIYDLWVKDCAMSFPGEEEPASSS